MTKHVCLFLFSNPAQSSLNLHCLVFMKTLLLPKKLTIQKKERRQSQQSKGRANVNNIVMGGKFPQCGWMDRRTFSGFPLRWVHPSRRQACNYRLPRHRAWAPNPSLLLTSWPKAQWFSSIFFKEGRKGACWHLGQEWDLFIDLWGASFRSLNGCIQGYPVRAFVE